MGRQNRQVQRRLGAVAGKGMTDALQISPTTRSKARSTAFIRSSSSRPKGLLIFERGRVESLSTITCESTRNPLALSGSTVMRQAASRTALVIGQITRLSSTAKSFDCNMRAGRGLPSSPCNEHEKIAPRFTASPHHSQPLPTQTEQHNEPPARPL